MKKSILMIGIACLLVIGTFGVASARYWFSPDLTIVSAGEGLRGVEVMVTYEGQPTPVRYLTDPATPPTAKNAILAVLLTAASTDKQVNLEFEGNYITGARLAY